MRGNQLHSPRSTKINIPAASAPRTAKLYHFPSPSVNGAIGTGEGFGRRQQGAPDPLVPVGITPTPQEGSTDTPPEGNTDNPLVGIPTPPPVGITDIPSGGTTDSPQGGTTENAKGVGRLPAEGRGNDISTFEQLSDRAFPTLRRTSSNSPPYF